jgi:hypothetical protein
MRSLSTSRPFLIGLFLITTLRAQSQSQVKIHISDAYGRTVLADWIKIKGSSTIIDDAAQDKVIGLPYGRYVIETLVRGFAITTVSALVDQPTQVINIAMRLGNYEGKATPILCSLSGHVEPGAAAVRVRVVQLFGSYTTDVPVDKGAFRVQNVECGDYLLIAMGESKLLGTTTATAGLVSTGVEIKVGGN